MHLITHPTAEAAADDVAQRLRAAISAAPGAAVLGLATGGTMRPVYAALAKADPDMSGVTTFNLDEYLGIGPDHPGSYHHYMNVALFDHLTHPPTAHLPRGDVSDPDAEARRYETLLSGGVDMQLLGLGENGHIGFNEPGSHGGSRTRVVTLSPGTRAANADAFGGPVPDHAISMGVASILAAGSILLLATGARKSDAVRRMLHDPIGPACPATFLRDHPDVTVVLDAAAAKDIA